LARQNDESSGTRCRSWTYDYTGNSSLRNSRRIRSGVCTTGTSALVGEPLSCDHYFRLSRSASPSVLTSHPVVLKFPHATSLLNVSSLSLFLSLSRRRRLSVSACARESLCRKRFIILVISSIDASIVVYCAEREPTHCSSFLRPRLFFPLARAIKKTGEPSLVNFGRNSAHFDSHAIREARKHLHFVRRQRRNAIT
jgi:hypothetical protein